MMTSSPIHPFKSKCDQMLPSIMSEKCPDQQLRKLDQVLQAAGIDVESAIKGLLPRRKKPKVPNQELMDKAEAKRLRKAQRRLSLKMKAD